MIIAHWLGRLECDWVDSVVHARENRRLTKSCCKRDRIKQRCPDIRNDSENGSGNPAVESHGALSGNESARLRRDLPRICRHSSAGPERLICNSGLTSCAALRCFAYRC